jgi:hypothetical protein
MQHLLSLAARPSERISATEPARGSWSVASTVTLQIQGPPSLQSCAFSFLLLMAILESLRRYLSSAEWQEYIESFIEANCMKFLHANSEDFTHEQYSIWKVWLSSTFEMDDF